MTTTHRHAAPTTPAGRPHGWPWYPVTYAAVAWMLPYLVNQLPGWAPLVIGAALAGIGLLVVCTLWPWDDYYGFNTHARLFVVSLAVCVTGWLYAVRALTDDGTPLPLWAYFLTGAALFAGWFAGLVLQAHKYTEKPPVPAPPLPKADDELVGDPALLRYREILTYAGVIPGCHIVKIVTSPRGGMQTVYLRPNRVPGKKAFSWGNLQGRLGDIRTEAAIILGDALGIDVQDDDVKLTKVNSATYRVHFTIGDVLKRTYPYPIRTVPRRPEEPSDLGFYETDAKVLITFFSREQGAQHCDILAGTGGGKSVTLNVLIAEDLACDAWEVWLFATSKLVPFAWAWLRPFMRGLTDRPAIDRVVGESEDEVLRALAEALNLAAMWNARTAGGPRGVKPGDGGLSIYIDEASDALKSNRKWVFKFKGRTVEMTASDMVAKLLEMARTSPIKVTRATQYGLMGAMGSSGSESRRNVLCAIVGKTTRQPDATSVAPGLPYGANVIGLRDNAVYVQPNLDEQEAHKAKLYGVFVNDDLGVDNVEPIVKAYTDWRNGLDPAATAKLATYADRWNPDRLTALVDWCRHEGYEWRLPGEPARRLGEPLPTGEPAAAATATATAEEPAGGGGVSLNTALQLIAESAGQPRNTFVDQLQAGTLDPRVLSAALQLMGQVPTAGPASPPPANPTAPPPAPKGRAPMTTPADDNDLPPLPDGELPDGWTSDGFDFEAMLAAFEGKPAPAAAGEDVPEDGRPADAGSVLNNPDTSDIRAKLEEMNRQEAWVASMRRLGDPLGSIAILLLHPKAQRYVRAGYVPTTTLAVVLGKVAADAPRDERKRAAVLLGMQLSKLSNGALKSGEIPRPAARELGIGDRGVSGYRVEDLRAAAEQLARGDAAA